jgi:hypothetical protein
MPDTDPRDLQEAIQNVHFKLLEFGRVHPQFNQMAEDIAELIISLHAAYEKLDRKIRQDHV